MILPRNAKLSRLINLCGILLFLTSLPTFSADTESKTEAVAGSDTSPKGEPDLNSGATLFFMEGRHKSLEGKFDEAIPLLERAQKEDSNNPFVNHILAETYLKAGSEDKAEAFGRKAVEGAPNNMEYRITLGAILASLKKYPDAKEQYQKIMELDPSNQRTPLLLGILEAESGQLEKGISILTKAIDSVQENYLAFFYRAKIYLEMDDLKKAKEDLEKSLTLRPNFVEAGTALGMLHERQGDIDLAIASYQRIQGSGRFKKRLAQLYVQKNEMAKALEELLEYEKVEPDDYTARVKIALIYFELKQYPAAIERLKVILKEQPEADNVRFYLGAVLEEKKEYEKALTEFKWVVKQSSFFKEAMLHASFLFRELGRNREGLEFSKKVLTQNPDVPEFYDMHASFFEVQKEYKQALKIVEQGIKKFPSDEKLLYFEGALYEKLGDRKRSVANMRKIIEGNANNAHALNFLGYTFAEMGENLEEAELLVLRAIALRPNDGFIEDSVGWVLFKRGKVDEAQQRLERALSLQPEEAIILEHLGDVYLHKKEVTKAVDLYKKAQILSKKKDREMAKKLENKIATLQKDKRIPSTEPSPIVPQP